MKASRFRTYCISLSFIALISFPFVNDQLKVINDIESFENRRLTGKPSFDVTLLDPYPAKYDTFYNDNFNLRNRLIRYFSLYNVGIFHRSSVPSVVIGYDGWLFTVGDEMDSYTGRNRLTSEELQSFKLELEYREKYLREKGIRFYFLVVPCKASIHSEKISYEYFRMHSDSWGEQLNNFLKENCSVKPIDIFTPFKEFKEDHDLYFKLDNHWNQLGGFYAANEVLNRMHLDFPEVKPLSLNGFSIQTTENCPANTDQMLGNLGIFHESCLEITPKNGFKAIDTNAKGYPPVPGFAYFWDYEKVRIIKGSRQPRLLIISDSFGGGIFPFLAENFSRTVKIFDSWQYGLNENIVEGEKPDAVLIIVNEPILRSFLKHTSRPG